MSSKAANAKRRKSKSKAKKPRSGKKDAKRALEVHTCRFVDWQPQAVAAMGVSGDGSRLAIGRADGDVEIWETQRFHLEQRIVGEEEMSLRTIAWGGRGGRRLFVAGLSGEIMEIDLVRQRIARRVNSNGGPVWAMAFDRGGGIRGGSWCQLAAACEDGSVRLYALGGGAAASARVEDDSSDDSDDDDSDGGGGGSKRGGAPAYSDDESDSDSDVASMRGGAGLELVRVFSRAEARALSVCWHPHGKYIFAGSADGRIRCLEASTGRVVHHMTVEDFGTGKRTMVWSLVVLSDWTVVSGDSLGHIQFWDGRPGSGVLMQSFAVFTRGADVLALAATDDEDAVFASGVDHRVVQLRRVAPGSGGGGSSSSGAAAEEASSGSTLAHATQMRWMYVSSQRSHTHDVNALVVLPGVLPKGGGLGGGDSLSVALAPQVVVSGGVDTQLCVYPSEAAVFQATDRVRKIPPFPHEPLGQLAPTARLLLARHARKLELWRLAPRKPKAKKLSKAKAKKIAKNGKAKAKATAAAAEEGESPAASASVPAAPAAVAPVVEHLVTVDVDSAHNLACSALAPRGDWLAFADGGDGFLKLLAVEGADDHAAALDLAPCSVAAGSYGRVARVQRLVFADDSRTLVCATDRYADAKELYVIRLTRDSSSGARSASVVHRFRRAQGVLRNPRKWWINAAGGGSNGSASWWGRADGANAAAQERAAPCTGLAISGDGQWLAAGDLSNRISVFSLDGHQQHCTLPRFATQHTAFAFNTHATSTCMLVVACASNAFYVYVRCPFFLNVASSRGVVTKSLCVGNYLTRPSRSLSPLLSLTRRYNVEQKRLSDWSELYTRSLPNDLLRLKAKIIGISFNPASPTSLLLHTHNACISAEIQLKPPAQCTFLDRSGKASSNAQGRKHAHAEPASKRLRLTDGSSAADSEDAAAASTGPTGKFTVIERFRPTLFAGFIDEDEMVIVQRPWLQIMQHFPDPLQVSRFGT